MSWAQMLGSYHYLNMLYYYELTKSNKEKEDKQDFFQVFKVTE